MAPWTFFAGEAIAYVGSVFDADFNAELEDLQWDLLSTSGGPTLLTDEGQRGTIPAGTLEPGEYQLRAYVRDALREVGTTWITFEVLADPEDLPPSIVDGIVAATPIDSNDNPPVSYFVEQCLVDINGDGYHDGHDLCQRLTFNAVVTDGSRCAGGPDLHLDRARGRRGRRYVHDAGFRDAARFRARGVRGRARRNRHGRQRQCPVRFPLHRRDLDLVGDPQRLPRGVGLLLLGLASGQV